MTTPVLHVSALFELAALALLANTGARDVFSIGLPVVAFIVLAYGSWLLVRGKRTQDAQQLANDWRDNYLAERQAREDAVRDAAEQREMKHAALNELAAAKMATDLSAVMTALLELQKTATLQTRLLERIAARFEATA